MAYGMVGNAFKPWPMAFTCPRNAQKPMADGFFFTRHHVEAAPMHDEAIPHGIKAMRHGFRASEEHMHTITAHQKLAEEILNDLATVADKFPTVDPTRLATDDFIRAHINVSVEFIATAIAVIEGRPELQAAARLDPSDGRAGLQYLEAFRTVHDRLLQMADQLKRAMKQRKALLAWQALQTYAIARGFARGAFNPELEANLDALRRDLGPRGRPRKKRGE